MASRQAQPKMNRQSCLSAVNPSTVTMTSPPRSRPSLGSNLAPVQMLDLMQRRYMMWSQSFRLVARGQTAQALSANVHLHAMSMLQPLLGDSCMWSAAIAVSTASGRLVYLFCAHTIHVDAKIRDLIGDKLRTWAESPKSTSCLRAWPYRRLPPSTACRSCNPCTHVDL